MNHHWTYSSSIIEDQQRINNKAFGQKSSWSEILDGWIEIKETASSYSSKLMALESIQIKKSQ